MAYDQLEPIGEERADFRNALLCSVVMNLAKGIWRDPKREPVFTTPYDFIPQWYADEWTEQEERPRQSVEQMKEVLVDIARFSKKK